MQESEQLRNKELEESYDDPQYQVGGFQLSDFVMAQLFARGELQELIQQCLDNSTHQLQPVILQKQNGPGCNTSVMSGIENFFEDQNSNLKLPQILQIEEVLNQNRAKVRDYILKKRQVKEEIKSQQRLLLESDVNQQEFKNGGIQDQQSTEQSSHNSNRYNALSQYHIINGLEDQFCRQQKQLIERVNDIEINVLKQFTMQQKLTKNSSLQGQPPVSLSQKQKPSPQEQSLSQASKSRTKRQKSSVDASCNDYSTVKPNVSSKTSVRAKRSANTMNPSKKGLELEYKAYEDNFKGSETESEDDDDEQDSEDIKFQKKLQKQFKKDEFISDGLIQNNQVNVSSSRPQRARANKATYQQQFQNFMPDQHSHYQLVSYQNYKSISAQPYIIFLSIEVMLMLNIHSHLSQYEVIGFLGGFCFESKASNQKYLLIHSAYPCDSLIPNQKERQKNVDLCPVSADNARQKIQNRGQQLLGWYHSHPFFPVEPSMIDIKNHSVYQQNFDLQKMPFIGLIIGPYSQKNRIESLMKIFHVKEQQPYNLNFKQMPSTKLRKSLINEIKDQFIKYKDHKDRIDMKEKWNSTGTREKKLIKALEMILDKNLTQKDKFDLQEEILNHLNENDVNEYFKQGVFSQNGQSINTNSTQADDYGALLSLTQQQQQNLLVDANFFQYSGEDHESSVMNSTVSKKISYFSVDSQSKIDKLIAKLEKMISSNLYGETSNSNDEQPPQQQFHYFDEQEALQQQFQQQMIPTSVGYIREEGQEQQTLQQQLLNPQLNQNMHFDPYN